MYLKIQTKSKTYKKIYSMTNINLMKKQLFTLMSICATCFLLTNTTLQAQEDTTRIRMGKKKIMIIEEKSKTDEAESLHKGISKFEQRIKTNEKKLQEFTDSIAIYTKNIAISANKKEQDLLQRRINRLENQVETKENIISAYRDEVNILKEELYTMKEKKFKNKEKELAKKEKELADKENDLGDWNYERKKKKQKKSFKGHSTGIYFGLNNFVNSDYKMELPTGGEFMELNTSRSSGFGLRFCDVDLAIIPGIAGITACLGADFNHYNFKQAITLKEDENGVIFGELQPDIDFETNKLIALNAYVPVMLELQIPTQKGRLHIAGGGFAGINAYAKTKQIYKVNGDKKKEKNRGDYQLSPFNYGLVANVGFSKISVFAKYSMVPFYKKDKGPELYPFTVGVALNFN